MSVRQTDPVDDAIVCKMTGKQHVVDVKEEKKRKRPQELVRFTQLFIIYTGSSH